MLQNVMGSLYMARIYVRNVSWLQVFEDVRSPNTKQHPGVLSIYHKSGARVLWCRGRDPMPGS